MATMLAGRTRGRAVDAWYRLRMGRDDWQAIDGDWISGTLPRAI